MRGWGKNRRKLDRRPFNSASKREQQFSLGRYQWECREEARSSTILGAGLAGVLEGSGGGGQLRKTLSGGPGPLSTRHYSHARECQRKKRCGCRKRNQNLGLGSLKSEIATDVQEQMLSRQLTFQSGAKRSRWARERPVRETVWASKGGGFAGRGPRPHLSAFPPPPPPPPPQLLLVWT